ncbi:EamA family transporter RarD [Martelella endophytica]|uniref:Permease n=1 Tax=Martelella endophytica TaxID=1486262 RepID=A0A0D5LR69_MAREN|nr:EamA family transporter RarD [Martelella endophytica]AJY46616.1 permease [Martelella endophytica]
MADQAATPSASVGEDTPKGFALALTVYLMWGILPIYLKLVADLPPLEVLAHRIVWSIPFSAVIVAAARQGGEVRAALKKPRVVVMAGFCALFISLNWGTYIWAVSNQHTVDAALGYFINPLFSIALAAVVLREKLARGQIAAIALAAIAVAILTIETGRLPLVALVLPFSWGIYALLRRTVPVGGNPGFMLEVLIMALPALAYIVWLEATGAGHLFSSPRTALLLVGCGAVTAIPLMIYANAAKLLRLSTIGIMQYIAPSAIFLVAIFIFREPLQASKLAAFALIWTALVVYTWSMLKARRRLRMASVKAG